MPFLRSGDLGLLHQDKPTSCTSSAAFANASIVERQSKSSAAGGNRSSCFLSVAPAASEQRRCRRFHSGLHVGDSGCFSRRVTHAINWRLARAAAPAFTLTSWHVAPCKIPECRRGKMEVDGWILFIRENTSRPECCNVRRECAEFWEKREGISPRLTAAPPSPARRQLELTRQPARKRASERARLLVLTDAVCRAFIYRSKRRADKCPECARRLCHQDVFLKKCFWHLTSLASLFAVSSARPPAHPPSEGRSIMI